MINKQRKIDGKQDVLVGHLSKLNKFGTVDHGVDSLAKNGAVTIPPECTIPSAPF